MMLVLRVFGIGTLGLFLSAAAFAQISTAQLDGKVTDDSGAVLPGATVTVTQTDTQAVRTVVTDGEGAYLLSNLAPGPYRLEVMLQGFRSYAQTGIVLQVAATATINVPLALGSVEETVTVEAAAPIVDVRSAGVSEVVESERIVELPLEGRQVTALLVLAGAAVNTGSPNTRSFQGAVNVSVAGGLPFGVGYVLDGAMHNDPQNNAGLPLPFPDALQEFRVATTGLSAENGMHSGASVNAITKSGSNRFTGTAFEFVRDKRFNATNPFARIGADGKRVDDGLLRNQYGGTLGGPILRDRLFFFGGYQGTHIRQTPASNVGFVPTPAMLRGDFTAYAAPQCNAGRQVTLRAPFVNNRVDQSLLSPAALKLASFLPEADDECGQVTFLQPADGDQGQGVVRMDYQVSANNSIFGRYMGTFDQAPAAYARTGNVLTLALGPGLDNLAQSLTVGNTTILGADLVNSLRGAFNRTSINRGNPGFFDPTDLGVRDFHSYRAQEMVLTVTGNFQISAGTASTGMFETDSYQVSDDLTMVRGRHQFGFGASVAYWNSYQTSHARSGGDWIINGQTTGSGLSDFLIGAVSSLEQNAPNILHMDMWYVGLYAQDAWRATDRVTINYGLRWEPWLGQQMLYGGASNFDRERFRNNVKSEMFVNAPAGMLYPGDAGFPSGQSGYKRRWLDVSPRVGVAWDVNGNGRLAVRSSYGLTYDFPSGDYMNINASAPPWGNRTRLETTSLDNPYAAFGGNPHPIPTARDTRFAASGAFGVMDPNIEPPRVQSWNATVERQLGTNWSATASYLGRYSDHLWAQVALNPGVFLGLGPCVINGVSYTMCSTNPNLNQRRLLSLENPREGNLFGPLDLHNSVGSQDYHGLRLTVARRAATGISLSANYTVSRCFGTATPGSFPQNSAGYTNPDDPEFDRGYCIQDRKHLANGTMTYQTPELSNAIARAVASNWRLSGILTVRSGARLNVISGQDNAMNGISNQRPNQVSDDVYGDSLLTYLNRSAFAQPALGTFGNFVFGGVEGPGYWDINLAISRLLQFGATRNLELRMEIFNLTNNFNWGTPNLNLNSPQFGRITTMTGAPRVMQFGIKYGF